MGGLIKEDCISRVSGSYGGGYILGLISYFYLIIDPRVKSSNSSSWF